MILCFSACATVNSKSGFEEQSRKTDENLAQNSQPTVPISPSQGDQNFAKSKIIVVKIKDANDEIKTFEYFLKDENQKKDLVTKVNESNCSIKSYSDFAYLECSMLTKAGYNTFISSAPCIGIEQHLRVDSCFSKFQKCEKTIISFKCDIEK